jgi:hypothetical protein
MTTMLVHAMVTIRQQRDRERQTDRQSSDDNDNNDSCCCYSGRHEEGGQCGVNVLYTRTHLVNVNKEGIERP